MKVQSISDVNFKRKRYVNPNTLMDIRELTHKMNREGIYESNGTVFSSSVVGGVKKDNVVFSSSIMFYASQIPDEYLPKMKSTINIGESSIKVDNLSGEITEVSKKFYQSTRKLINKMDKYLDIFNRYYNNNSVVEKRRLNIKGFTEEGESWITKMNPLS